MADQKELKKRLKVLMNLPENQVCSDCPERQPRWASLIVPPPGAPEGSLPMGAFCCLECSGSHRRLGVHIAFVRSINLDSWKEREVQAMENGGNRKVNAVFEAHLARSGVQKPSNHADGPTRERFIRDKYERRKFYDASAFANLPPAAAPSAANFDPRAGTTSDAVLGPPSDAARQRLEERRSRASAVPPRASSAEYLEEIKERGGERRREAPTRLNSNLSVKSAPANSRRHVAKAPASAPVDLLDFSSEANFSAPPRTTSTESVDLFDFLTASNNNANARFSESAPFHESTMSSDALAGTPPTQRTVRSDSYNYDSSRGGRRSEAYDLAPVMPSHSAKSSTSADIMSLYSGNHFGSQQQQPGYTTNPYGNPAGVTQMMQQMNLQNSPMMAQQQQQQAMMYQQQMMMMQQQQQQQQYLMQQQGGNNSMMNMMMPGHGGGSSGNVGGGFGAPMGSGPPLATFPTSTGANPAYRGSNSRSVPDKEDPFAQFGLNVFRS